MKEIYNLLIHDPLYNGLVFLIDTIPWVDVGIIVVLFTVVVKLILFPLSRKAVVTQLKMKKLEPEMAALKEKYTDKQEQARQIMSFYKEKGINPFSSFFLVLIQLPIIIGLYQIFYNSGLPNIDSTILYSFVPVPENINMYFLGLINVADKSLILALLAGVSSYFQIKFSVPPMKKRDASSTPNFKDDLARSMNIQMRYIFPVIAFVISYNISAAVALYWITSNIFMIGQEVVVRRKINSQKN